MLKNITIGQYYPGNSAIHNLDARTKMIIAILLLVAVFVVKSFWGFIALGAFLGIIIGVSKINVRQVLKSIRPLLFIIIFTFALNVLFFQGETILASFGVINISLEGIIKAVFISIRLMLLIIATSMLTYTTSPMQLTDGMESLLAPLKKVKFPVHELAMMMSIAMRFIPTLIEETDRIMKAQTARGAEFDSKNLFKKAKNMIPLLVPLFVSAFKRADELALAMESRCYRGGENRTKFKILKMGKNDVAAFVIAVAFCVLCMIWL